MHNKFINTPFVFQTYTYSKESYEYDIANIHKYLSYIYYSKDIDSGFDVFINDFFSICFKVVVYITFMLEKGVVFNRNDFEKFLKFSSKDFFYVNDKFINLANINLINLNKMIDDNYSEVVNINSIEYKNHLAYIESIGVNRSTAYKFINGHILESSLTKFLNEYKNFVKKKEIEHVASIYPEGQPRVQEINKVNKHFNENCSISTLIKRSEINSNCQFFQRIISDLSSV